MQRKRKKAWKFVVYILFPQFYAIVDAAIGKTLYVVWLYAAASAATTTISTATTFDSWVHWASVTERQTDSARKTTAVSTIINSNWNWKANLLTLSTSNLEDICTKYKTIELWASRTRKKSSMIQDSKTESESTNEKTPTQDYYFFFPLMLSWFSIWLHFLCVHQLNILTFLYWKIIFSHRQF